MSDSIRPKELILPTFSEDVLQYLSPSSLRYPVKFNQKIYILKPNVCIVFAGSVFHFKRLLEDIRQFCKYHDVITSEMVIGFLNERRDEIWNDLDSKAQTVRLHILSKIKSPLFFKVDLISKLILTQMMG